MTSGSGQRHDGGIPSFAAAILAHWQGMPREAWEHFTDVGQAGGRDAAYVALARALQVAPAVASGDSRLVDEAERGLRLLPEAAVGGLPFEWYLVVSRALIALSRGEVDQAVALMEKVPCDCVLPSVNFHRSVVCLRAGRDAEAGAALRRLRPLAQQPSYLRVGALLVNAVLQSRAGADATAHRLLESALAVAEPHGIIQPFLDVNIDSRRLLVHHAAQGTRYTGFLAARIADWEQSDSSGLGLRLSPREREVLGYLRGTMSTVEIAAALGISVNTLKTHRRLLYRKLGVTSRKEAVSWTGLGPSLRGSVSVED
ncbi:LuxR C-terminal-related transcriptional regulator [Nocardioides alcanivorans]|uniref:LuxR C-terminal-related transcriptional regulator n=1 Tax=Nocardioides alcanivorans TaxID=2897352 RepID=UPI001F216E5F|nr:LuxR C-terminal-related transcriptional regulator [Nocardioides alcanivorans]